MQGWRVQHWSPKGHAICSTEVLLGTLACMQVTLLSWLPGGEEFAPAVTMQLAAGTAGNDAGPAAKPTAATATPSALPASQLLFQATVTANLNCSHRAQTAWRKADGEAARHATPAAACPPPADQLFIQVGTEMLLWEAVSWPISCLLPGCLMPSRWS